MLVLEPRVSAWPVMDASRSIDALLVVVRRVASRNKYIMCSMFVFDSFESNKKSEFTSWHITHLDKVIKSQ
jgi:hypothetical protein